MRWIAFASVLAASAIALAQPASDPASEADALAKKGDFVGAAGKFKLAYARDPKPATICNIGVAYYKAKQLARAQLFLNRCLERGTALEQSFVDQVRAVLTAIEQNLRAGDFTPIDITVDPQGATVTVVEYGDDEAFIGARLLWLPAGAHKLTARAEGYVEQTVEVDAKGRDPQPVKISLVKTTAELGRLLGPPAEGSGSAGTHEGSGSGSAATSTGTGSGSAAIIVQPPPEERPSRPSKIPAIAATGVAVGGIVMAIVGFKKAHDRSDYSQFAVTPAVFEEDKHAITAWNTLMVTGVGVGVLGAAAAGYLWSRVTRSSHVEVQTSDRGVALGVTGQW